MTFTTIRWSFRAAAAAATLSLIAVGLTPPALADQAAPTQAQLQKQLAQLQHEMQAEQHRLQSLQHRLTELQSKAGVRTTAHVKTKAHAQRRAVASTSPVLTKSVRVQSLALTSAAQNSAAEAPMDTTSGSDTRSYGEPAPTQRSVKQVYEEQNALFSKGLTLTPGITYAYGDNHFFTLNGFMALGAIFLGNINVSAQQNNVVTPSMTATYGVNKRLQLDVNVPFVARGSTYSSVGANNSSQQASQTTVRTAGIGDISGGFYYNLPRRTVGGPDVIVNAQFTAPTGTAPYGIKVVQATHNDSLSYATTLPTGQGVWGVSGGATVIKTVDPAIIFAGANYYYEIPGHFHDISPTVGQVTPGSVAPGNAVSITLGTAFALNDRMSTTFSFQDTFVAPTRIRPDGAPWQTVAGSSLNAGVFNIGATYAVNKHVSWQTLLGIGVTHDAPNFTLSFRFPHSP